LLTATPSVGIYAKLGRHALVRLSYDPSLAYQLGGKREASEATGWYWGTSSRGRTMPVPTDVTAYGNTMRLVDSTQDAHHFDLSRGMLGFANNFGVSLSTIF